MTLVLTTDHSEKDPNPFLTVDGCKLHTFTENVLMISSMPEKQFPDCIYCDQCLSFYLTHHITKFGVELFTQFNYPALFGNIKQDGDCRKITRQRRCQRFGCPHIKLTAGNAVAAPPAQYHNLRWCDVSTCFALCPRPLAGASHRHLWTTWSAPVIKRKTCTPAVCFMRGYMTRWLRYSQSPCRSIFTAGRVLCGINSIACPTITVGFLSTVASNAMRWPLWYGRCQYKWASVLFTDWHFIPATPASARIKRGCLSSCPAHYRLLLESASL